MILKMNQIRSEIVRNLWKPISVFIVCLFIILISSCYSSPTLDLETLQSREFLIKSIDFYVTHANESTVEYDELFQAIKEEAFPDLAEAAFEQFNVELNFEIVEDLQFERFRSSPLGSIEKTNGYNVDIFEFDHHYSGDQWFIVAIFADFEKNDFSAAITLKKRNEEGGSDLFIDLPFSN